MPRTLVFVCIVLVVAGATIDLSLRVLMRDLAVVTVRRGALANRTRGTWQLQMQCKGGDACASELHPDTIQCTNKGWDSVQTHWACEATVDTRVRLGSTNVRCEEWDRPGDDFVRFGSCIVDYELFFTKIRMPSEEVQLPRSRSADDAERRVQEEQNATFVFFLLFVSAVGVATVCRGHCNGHVASTVTHTVVREEVHMPPPPSTVVHHYIPTPTVWATPAPVVIQQHHVHTVTPPMVH